MKIVVVPGINGLGVTQGVEKSYLEVLERQDFEKINLNNGNIEEQLEQIVGGTKRYFNGGKVLFFGGDHSISYGLVLNFFEKYKNGKLIVFDAHPDLMEQMPEPGHEEWLRAVVEKTGIDGKRILIVGVRKNSENVDKREIDYAKEKGIKIIYSDEFDSRREEILEFIGSGELYCSFDIDVFDSSIIASTGYPEENGLNEGQMFRLLEEIGEKINYFDLVEVNLEKGSEEEKKRTRDVVEKVLSEFG